MSPHGLRLAALLACGAIVSRGLPAITGAGGRPWLGLALLMLGGLVWLSGVPLAMERARETRAGARRPAQMHELRPLAYGAAIVGMAALVIAAVFTT